MLFDLPMLSLLVLTPVVGAVVVFLVGKDENVARIAGTSISLIPLALSFLLILGFFAGTGVELTAFKFDEGSRLTYYAYERQEWIGVLGVNYALGTDQLSVPLVFLTTLLTTLSLIFSWDVGHRVREFYAMFLFMETTVLGVFLSLDFFLFFIFWEVGLVPMYFIIAVWGGPRKKYAALKFFLYTQAASLLVLGGIFAFRFYSGSFDMVELIERHPIPAGVVQNLLFVAMFIGFGTKLPMFPLHTWLPDAHVEAPTGGSVMLAGILLKLGGYGLVRVNMQMMPDATLELYWLTLSVGVLSILYGAIVCLAQDDLKRMVAFSSVSHMGFVTLGMAIGARGSTLGLSGAIFQMFAHGLISAAMFMVAGSVGHKVGTRNISELGGLSKRAPVLTTFMVTAFLASLGLPGLVGFVAELTVFLGTYETFGLFLALPITTVALTAAYYIYALQRSVFGPVNERLGVVPDAHGFEAVPLSVLVALFAVFGLMPAILFDMIGRWVVVVLGGG